MRDKNTGGPAFPILADVRPNMDKEWCGMTLRDYFAAKAMQGFVTNIGVVGGLAPSDDDMARYSYDLADAMLRARENT